MFIKPDKYMNLNTSTLKIAGDIIDKILKTNTNHIKYENLFQEFFIKYKDDTEYILYPALSFLYLVGKIKYKKSKDELELIK